MNNSFRESYYYSRLCDEKTKLKFFRAKRHWFIITLAITFFLIILGYHFSQASKVYRVTVSGNKLLSEEMIRNLSSIDNTTHYWLFWPGSIAKKIKQHPLVKTAKVQRQDAHIIAITVQEKEALAYYYKEGNSFLWLADSEPMLLDENSLNLVTNVPLIEGYTEEELAKIQKDYREIPLKLLAEISEIHRYPMSYDDNFAEVIMRDGNYVFVSPSGLKYLQSYYAVASGIASKDPVCLYFDDVTKTGYRSACPWQKVKENTTHQNEASTSETKQDN